LCREQARDCRSASGHDSPSAKDAAVRLDACQGAQLPCQGQRPKDEQPMAVCSPERLAAPLPEWLAAQQVQRVEWV